MDRRLEVRGSLSTSVRLWFWEISSRGLLRYLFHLFCKLLQKIITCVGAVLPWDAASIQAHPDQSADSPAHLARSTDRPALHARKRLGMLARFLFAFIRFQQALGYLDTMWRDSVPEETLRTPVNPSGKGSKRKQDDLALEEHECWVETLQKKLPDEDDPEDPSYEPTKSETDSEEYKSQNDTETDLEVEEKDGVVMLKEDPKEGPNAEDGNAAGPPKAGANGGEPLEFRTSGDGSETLRWRVPKRISNERETDAERSPQSRRNATRHATATVGTASASSNSQEQCVNVSSE